MDFLNKAVAQLSELFRSLTPGARIMAGLLLAAIVVSLVFLFRVESSHSDEMLLGGREFSGAEIALAEAAFAKANLAHSEVVGNKIRIPRGQKAAYLAALAENNALPEDFGTALTTASASENPFMSSRSLDLRVQNAKQRELSLILSRMQGVEVATVTYDEIDKPGFPRRKEKSAMVAVKPAAGSEVSPEQIRAIRNTVAGAYAGLDRQNVTVTDIATGRSYAGTSPDGLGSAEDHVYAEAKQRFERDWQAKIYDRLRMIPGVVVGVNVDLDPDLLHQTTSHKIDPKAVAVQTAESSENSTSTQPGTSGRPGTAPNALVNTPAAVSQDKGAQSTSEKTDSTQASVVGQDRITSRRAPLTPKQVQVVVDVPYSYYRKIFTERNPPAPGEQPKTPQQADLDKIEAEQRKRIEETVVKLLPRPESGNDPFVPVTVTSFQDLAQAPLAGPSMVETMTTWLGENWQTLAMIGVGAFSLLMLRSMLKSPAPAAAPQAGTDAAATPGAAAAHEAAAEPAEEEPQTVKLPRRRFNSSGPTLRDELREIVNEDPDAAATVLRAWIGDAA